MVSLGVGGWLEGAKGVGMTTLKWGFWGFMIILAMGLIGWLGFKWFKNKTLYLYPVKLTQVFDNGTKKTIYGLKGGKILINNVWDFRIKVPGKFGTKDLGYMPDFSKADSDGTISFLTNGDGTLWQQMEEKLITTEYVQARDDKGKLLFNEDGSPKVAEGYKLIMKPIPTDIKQVTLNKMKAWSEIVNKNKLTVFTIAIVAFLVMVVAHLISLYIQTKIKCGIPAP